MSAQPSPLLHVVEGAKLVELSYNGANASGQSIEIPEMPPEAPPKPPNAEVPWVPIGLWGLAMLLTLFVFEASEVKALTQHFFTNLRFKKKAPCSTCAYFSDNVYLKCTVRPTDVLTERAVDCKDFCPRSPKTASNVNPPKI